ncbi:unnamed protein product [Prunus brigantina]
MKNLIQDNAQSSWKLRLVVGRKEGNPAEMMDSDEEIQKEVRGRAKWIAEIEERLGGVNEAEDSCIYKVPSKLRRVKQDAYNPRVVSIGPFHRGDPDLVAGMRKHKWRYMLSFLQQTDDPYESRSCLKNCTEAIYNLDMKVRQCYAENVEYDKNNLAQIMLLDGCFILELFLRYYAKNAGEKSKPDPVFKSSWMVTALQHDLALLENQIPFFILEVLYEVVRPFVVSRKPPHSVAGLALMFFQPLSRKSIPKEDQDKLGADFKHLLDLLHKFYFLPVPHDHEVSIKLNFNMELSSNSNIKEEEPLCNLFFRKMRRKMQTFSFLPELADPDSKNKWGFNCSATQLLESGIRFKVGSSEDQLLNITFSNGVIRFPPLVMDDSASSVLRNLIAFEQCSLSNMHGVTSYAFLIKSLIRSSADIKRLRQYGIIQHNWIGDQENFSQFEGIVDGVVMKDFYIDRLCAEVNAYTSRYWFRRYIKYLYRTYFSSAWSKIVFIASILAFILTSLQTYFTIYPR